MLKEVQALFRGEPLLQVYFFGNAGQFGVMGSYGWIGQNGWRHGLSENSGCAKVAVSVRDKS
jgi:hypothetical protein